FILTKTDLIEVLEDLAVESGTKIEVLSSSSEEGKMLLSFGGLGAILRYNIS
ncbi:MAG TPA: peptide chain release factor 1, partial [Candidatus Dadabacteria bacterium]|nr:peptide chain release factor 1 [Candidatus Dadabacteria bacterium]